MNKEQSWKFCGWTCLSAFGLWSRNFHITSFSHELPWEPQGERPQVDENDVVKMLHDRNPGHILQVKPFIFLDVVENAT